MVQDLVTVRPGHADVRDDKIVTPRIEFGDARSSVLRRLDGVVQLLERMLDEAADHPLIVDHQNFAHGIHLGKMF